MQMRGLERMLGMETQESSGLRGRAVSRGEAWAPGAGY